MMTIKEKITAVLDEKTSVTESMRLLDDIDQTTFENALHDEDIQRQFDAYKKNRPVLPTSHELTDQRIDDMWNSIMEKSKRSIADRHVSSESFFNRIRGFFPMIFGQTPQVRYALVCVFFLVVSTVIVSRHGSWFETSNNGMKGNGVQQATLEYALVGKDAELIRADRPVRENDTLAFRVITHKKGYYSIGVEYNRRIDWVLRNRNFPAGTFDIQNVYSVEGNAGKNTLILVSSENPLDTDAIHQDDIIKALKNGSSTVTVNAVPARLECRQIHVNRK